MESVDEKEADHSSGGVDNDRKELSDNIMSMIGFLCKKYDFRYNSVMKCTEYRPKERIIGAISLWMPVCRSV